MGAHDATVSYESTPTDEELARFDRYIAAHPPRRENDRISGQAECPHCVWMIDYAVSRDFLTTDEVIRVRISCDCGFEHEGHPPNAASCGFEAMTTMPVPEAME